VTAAPGSRPQREACGLLQRPWPTRESELRGDGSCVDETGRETEVATSAPHCVGDWHGTSWTSERSRLSGLNEQVLVACRANVAELARHWQKRSWPRAGNGAARGALALSRGTGFNLSDGDPRNQARFGFEQSLPLFREAGDPLGAALSRRRIGHVLPRSTTRTGRRPVVLEQAMNLSGEAGTLSRTEQEECKKSLLVIAMVRQVLARSSSAT